MLRFQDRFYIPKSETLNSDPRVCGIYPFIFLLGSSTDSGVCSLGVWKLSSRGSVSTQH